MTDTDNIAMSPMVTEETSFASSDEAATAWSINNKTIEKLNTRLKNERKKKKILEQKLTKLMIEEDIDTISANGSRLTLYKKLTSSKNSDSS